MQISKYIFEKNQTEDKNYFTMFILCIDNYRLQVIKSEFLLDFIFKVVSFFFDIIHGVVRARLHISEIEGKIKRAKDGRESKKRILPLLKQKDIEKFKVSSFNHCHWSYINRQMKRKVVLKKILREIAKERKIRYEGYPVKETFEGITFEVVRKYQGLMDITADLQVCTAVRQDLKRGFLKGQHIRYIMKNRFGKVVGTVNFQYQGYIGSASVYGLGNRHSSLDDTNNNTIEAKAYRAFKAKYEAPFLEGKWVTQALHNSFREK